jgi:hypothetical protein
MPLAVGDSGLLIPFPYAFELDITTLGQFFEFVVTGKLRTLVP